MANHDCNMSATICAQQALDDQIFKSTKFSTYENQGQSSLTLQSYIFFGSNNGIWRIYPGKELNQTACNNQDLRKRPWYVGATSVQKELVVMMDSGLGSLILSASTGTDTFFDAARNVTLELLGTLSRGDSVSVLTFGSSLSSLVGKGTVNSASSVDDPAFLAPLSINVSNIQDPGTAGLKANLTLGLLAALGRFDESLTQLKVVIIITAGDISGENLPESLVQDLRNVRIFIYRFLGSRDGNDDVTTMLKNVSCTLRGWYEEAFYSVPNPLGTLQSYYSYVARLRFNQSSQGKPYWVPQFTSTTGLGTLIAVAYPAFDGETLVGVAGADLLVDNLKLTASDLDSLLTGRNTLNPLPISDPPPPIACNQTLGVQDDTFCQSVLPSRVTGFCTNDTDTNPDTREALLERVCCKDCCPWKSDDGLPTGELVGIIVGSSVLGIVFAALCCCVIWKFCMRENRPPRPVHPGADQMRSPASESGVSDPRHSSKNSPVYKYDDVM